MPRRPLPASARSLLSFLLRDRAVQLEVFNRLRAAEGFEGRSLLDEIAARTEDRGLKERLSRHAADEARHERLFEELLVRLGGTPSPVPAATFLAELDRLSERQRRLADTAAAPEEALVDLLAALREIERRAVLAMTVLKSVLPIGHPGRLTLASVLADEGRHVAWVSEELERRACTGWRDGVERATARFEAIAAAAEAAVRPALPWTRRRLRLTALERIAATLPPDERDGYVARQARRIRQEPGRGASPVWTLLRLRLSPARVSAA